MAALRKRAGRAAGDSHLFPVRMLSILFVFISLAVIPASAVPKSESKGPVPQEFLIPVDSVIRERNQNGAVLLVDVRPAAQFEKLRIPGSLNIPLFAIKTKTFLKRIALVLVDAGYRCGVIAAECELLRKAGFRVRVLDGGLYGWSRNGGALEGDDSVRKALNRVPPMHLFPEKDYRRWIVLDVSQASHADISAVFPSYISVPYMQDDAAFAARYEMHLKKAMTDPFDRVLVVDERGENYQIAWSGPCGTLPFEKSSSWKAASKRTRNT